MQENDLNFDIAVQPQEQLNQKSSFIDDPIQHIEDFFSGIPNNLQKVGSYIEQSPFLKLGIGALARAASGRINNIRGSDLARHVGAGALRDLPSALTYSARLAEQRRLFNPGTYAEFQGAYAGEGTNIGGQMLRNKMLAIYSKLPNEALKAKFRAYMQDKGIQI